MLGIEYDVELITLTTVTKIEAQICNAVQAFSGELFDCSVLQLGEDGLECVNDASGEHNRAGIVTHGIREENAYGGEHAGHCGDEHCWDAQSACESTGVQRTASAEGYERELTRVVAALDGDDADGFLHVRFYDAKDAGGEFFYGGQRAFLLIEDLSGFLVIDGNAAA